MIDDAPFVIGTAGHVDHGKSTLVRALTGIDPDRLAEEKERHLTIDLGFAWLTLPGGRTVSVIDVPGHERFIRNMLAGVGGIDVALLVIAADDGPMPQTREHLAILDLLGIQRGVVAVSRADLVDSDWRELVVEESRELLQGTSLAGAPVIPVSSVTGEGLETLKQTLDVALARISGRDSAGRPRLPIDRSFPISGFGTVVTGTLLDGELRTGQDMMIYPSQRPVRIRGIQAHQQQLEHVRAGSRVALNLGGIDHDEIQRGDVLGIAGAMVPSMRLDIRMSILDDAPIIVQQNAELIVFAGAAEAPARVTLLDVDQIGPGEKGWVQLRLAQPITAIRGDRLILRWPSPATTIGGGTVLDPNPARHKRFREEIIGRLSVLAEGTPEDLLLQQLGDRAIDIGELAAATGIVEIRSVVTGLFDSGDVKVLPQGSKDSFSDQSIVVRASVLDRSALAVGDVIQSHHATHPLSPGYRRDDVRRLLNIGSSRTFDAVVQELERQGVVRTDGALIAAPDFEISLTEAQRAVADGFLKAAHVSPFSPPSPGDLGVADDLLAALQAMGEVVRVTEQIAYPAEVLAEIQARVLEKLDRDRTLSLAEYRDMFNTSRKYAQPTLEYFDERRITRRTGDVRVRNRGTGA